ncbi:MAG: dTDP-4-dehydrorhamnose 3,5-epimerase [Nitrosotalea sp.]
MIFTKTKFDGVFIIEPEKSEDERGFFARVWDQEVFEEKKLNPKVVQCNISFNKKRGTIRGMHYQTSPYEEAKLVRCTKGSAFDVMIDLRPKSKSFKNWLSVEISSESYKMIYVPEGFALGFQTLEDDTELHYQMSQKYMPEYARGIRWDEEIFKISWPLKPTVISKKDLSYDAFK